MDIDELEQMLLAAGIGSTADMEMAKQTELAQVGGFGVFLRTIVGLDRESVQEHFFEFISNGSSADQIEFVNLVIEHLTSNGLIDPGLLYESPFTDFAPDGPNNLFPGVKVDQFLSSVLKLNRTAVAGDFSADVG